MSPAALIDTNIVIYFGGRDHPLKASCVEILRLAVDHPSTFCTDVEVLQELLHRYLAIRIWPESKTTFNAFARMMVGRIEAVHAVDVQHASTLANKYAGLSARDLLHAAIMNRLGIKHIVSADRGFDTLPNIQRLDPLDWQKWSPALIGS